MPNCWPSTICRRGWLKTEGRRLISGEKPVVMEKHKLSGPATGLQEAVSRPNLDPALVLARPGFGLALPGFGLIDPSLFPWMWVPP